MLEEDKLVCPYCEKVIRYERPLFCPYCGRKIEPITQKDLEGENAPIYRWSRVAPNMMYLFVGWLIFIIPATLILGRIGFVVLSLLLAVSILLLLLGSLFSNRALDR